MTIPHDKFCVLPWISLETSPIGTVRPCCLAEEELVDNAGEKFDLNTASLTTIQNCHGMRKLRQQFIDGEQPETCSKCWNEERAGRDSKRIHTLNRLKHILPTQDWTLDAKPLMFLDLKLGNICNLKCRICGSWSSSTFATEELKFLPPHVNKKESNHYTMLSKGAWPRENKTFWDEIDRIINEVRYIEFTGGEPFMIKEHFDLLRSLADRGMAKHIEIHYNTNGTQFPEYAEEIWKHFKTVEIAFSIDDIGNRFEYQRSGTKWDEVCDNISKFKELKRRNHNIQLQVCTTVNVFNVYYIEEVANWIDTQKFDFVYWNMMHEARHFSISSLPQQVKATITSKLLTSNVSDKTQQEFKQIIDFMNNGASLDGTKLLTEIAEVDRRRNENLTTVAPEFAQLINYEKT
jgi:MoaA/NifB/PqqE/SkfB family radical SAM enzyme